MFRAVDNTWRVSMAQTKAEPGCILVGFHLNIIILECTYKVIFSHETNMISLHVRLLVALDFWIL